MDEQLKKEKIVLKHMLRVQVMNTNRMEDKDCEELFGLTLYETRGVLYSLLKKGFLVPSRYKNIFRIKE